MALKRFCFIATWLVIQGCTDKARLDFERCEELAAGKKYDEARKACELAASKDPESKAGKLAAAKLPVLATEQSDSESQREATQAKLLSGLHRENERLDTLKRKMERIIAREESLKTQLAHATEAAEKTRLEAEVSKAGAERASLRAEVNGGGGDNKKPCSCPPNDPLCSCL